VAGYIHKTCRQTLWLVKRDLQRVLVVRGDRWAGNLHLIWSLFGGVSKLDFCTQRRMAVNFQRAAFPVVVGPPPNQDGDFAIYAFQG
jgi:hypothetical protein